MEKENGEKIMDTFFKYGKKDYIRGVTVGVIA